MTDPSTERPLSISTTDSDDPVVLKAEVSTLRAKLNSRERRAAARRTVRGVLAAVLIAISAFALIASVIGLWGATTILNTNRWVSTVAPLPQQPAVATAVAQYATDQIFEVVDVEQRLQAVLPPQASFIAGTLSGQLHDAVEKTVRTVVVSPQFHEIWIAANRLAHQHALAIINGTSAVVAAQGEHVDINLLPLINQVLRQLSDQLPTLFGKTINLPDLSSGVIPTDLRDKVQTALGVPLPANFAQFTIYDAGQLHAIQRAVVTFKRDIAALVVLTVLVLAAALLISPRRRRTLLQLGIWLVIAAVAVTSALRAVRTQLLAEVPRGVYRDAAAATLSTITAVLRTRGTQIIWLGVLLAVVMYLIGPGRIPVWLRHHGSNAMHGAGRQLSRGWAATRARGPGWVAGHLDAVRLGGVVVAVIAALLLSSWAGLLVVAIILAAFEIAVTLVGRGRSRLA
jgi:hypothetical protein